MTDEHRHLDGVFADAYYMNSPKAVSRPKKRSGFGPPKRYPCPSCYRPGPVRDAYCDGCESSGAATAHREAHG